ncbi:hypothetical protein COLO4_10460 [Corchorus olitorius]|uniref:Uncharacterized protein n=1 Tax=Corchorus olitorius TaxID=93759 RepID=A0A1R3K8G6_9ROSI|nr:hypothetical protein COLO4_10460 [Corchorus olitorius]
MIGSLNYEGDETIMRCQGFVEGDEGVSEGPLFLSVLTSGSCCERALIATVPCWTKEDSDLAFEANRMKAAV